ncbi:MAG: alcohol acetyltransferase [Eubacteriales bacterium]|nr:alcohol acetyltransferase [Eubacteriales bacterium]
MAQQKRLHRKLDNVALAFPAASGKMDSRVFRIYCKLNEEVDKRLLREALKATVQKYPMFQSVLKRGNFWYYFEKTDTEPVVRTEKKGTVPCEPIYEKEEETVLYRLTCRDQYINLEIFHALTDGAGAVAFLQDIVQGYLSRSHGLAQEETEPSPLEEQEEDSFFRNYSGEKQEKLTRKSRAAYQIEGHRIAQSQMRILECTLSAQKLLAQTKQRGASVTEYLTAVVIEAIGKSMYERHGKYLKKPVTLMIPVNLRGYYPSKSMSNFFGWMEIEYSFTQESYFGDILEHVKKRFAQDLTKEQVAARMNHYIGIEKQPLLKLVPLGAKDFFLKLGTQLGSRNVTAVFSNLGVIRMAPQYQPCIDRFGAIASTDKMQMCACSFGDRFYFSITSKYLHSDIPHYIVERLRGDGIAVSRCGLTNPSPRSRV